jgi:glycosyltransferase involved in cell wall biosynthesis
VKILVYPHDLAVGGSQINAIEIARGVADLGHEVTVFGYPGPLVEKIAELGLDFVASPRPGRRPSLSVMTALAAVVRTRGIEVLHGYEWPPILEAWLVARRTGRLATGTVMSMAVADFIPRSIPLMVGTEQIADAERRSGRPAVDLMEPPVDLATNNPHLDLDTEGFRRAHGIRHGEVLVVVVSRLATEMKREGLLVAARVVSDLAAEHPVRLLVVGDGPARADLEALVAGLPARRGGPAVQLVGELADPRVAYAAADVALGMGSSALRAMAFHKPLIVQGEAGFWETLRPDTLPGFLWTGWYGAGHGSATGAVRLRTQLVPLLVDARLRGDLGAFALSTVQERFSLATAAERQVNVYEAELATRTSTASAPSVLAKSGAGFARYNVERAVARLGGRVRVDDFNARPVVARLGPAVGKGS